MDAPGDNTTPDENRVRRRVVASDIAGAGNEGRNGCLIIGAVLGIVLGALFAFFGLPPLINHFFAEEHVPLGQAYVSDGRSIKAVSVQQVSTGTVVQLEITTNTTWMPKPTNFTLEYSSGGSWAKATGVLDETTGKPANFDAPQLGQQSTVDVVFPYEPDRGTPRYIHLGEPHIRLEMLEVAASD